MVTDAQPCGILSGLLEKSTVRGYVPESLTYRQMHYIYISADLLASSVLDTPMPPYIDALTYRTSYNQHIDIPYIDTSTYISHIVQSTIDISYIDTST